MATREERQQKQRECRALLEGFWPEAFSFSRPRPLKLGIFEELVADAARRGLPFDAAILKAAIKAYVCRYAYQRAMSMTNVRVGLDGEHAGEVSAAQREYSRLQVQRIDAKAKEKKRKREEEAGKSAKPPAGQSGA